MHTPNPLLNIGQPVDRQDGLINQSIGEFVKNSSFVRSLRGKGMCSPGPVPEQSLTAIPDQNQSEEFDKTSRQIPVSSASTAYITEAAIAEPSGSHWRLAENES
jgi:hypothetical protein